MWVLIVLVFATLYQSPTMAESTSELKVLQGNSDFTNDFYQVLAQKQGNVFFSPISAHAALSMAYQGAQGSTAEKFASTLKVPEARSTAEGYKEIITRLNDVKNVTLLMANKIFVQESAELLEDFKNALTKNFLSDVQKLNFAKNEESAKAINDWVEEQTRNKIKDLIQSNDLNDLTRLVLVNAIYFKGDWLNKFKKEATKTEPFYINDNDSVDVQMMHIKRKFRYANSQALDAQILELPYANEALSMIIILPNKRNGIKELEAKLANTSITEVTKDLWNTEVNVALPRFKIETTIDLEEILTKLGLGEIFDENKANFKGMIKLNPGENLYVSKAVQKAFIEVNEEGAEAAAATDVIIESRILLNFEFIVDHPFIMQLVESSQTVLFQGRIVKPKRFHSRKHFRKYRKNKKFHRQHKVSTVEE